MNTDKPESLKVFKAHAQMSWGHEWVEDHGALNYTEFNKIFTPLQSKISSLESDRERLLSLTSKAWEAAVEYEYRSHFGKVPTDVPNKEQWFKENGI